MTSVKALLSMSWKLSTMCYFPSRASLRVLPSSRSRFPDRWMRNLISSVGFAIKMNPSVFRLEDAKWGGRLGARREWWEQLYWTCPRVSLVVDSVRYLTSCVSRTTSIIAEWPSSYFWPFLRQGCQFKPFVVEVFSLLAMSNLLLEGL